jgi:hypothetical protein
MADRPTPENPPQEPTPGQGVPPADATEPLPPAPGPAAAGQGPPAASYGAPAGGPAGPGAPPQGYGVPAAARGPSGPGRWWGEATSSPGSRAVLVVFGVLAVVVLLVGAGLVGSFVVHRVQHAVVASGSDDQRRWGDDQQRGGDTPFGNNGRGRGNGNGREDGGRGGSDRGPGNGNGLGQGNGNGLGQGNGMGRGNGMGVLPGLGSVLHGEFTTSLTGAPVVMLFQTGEVTDVTEGTSLTVRSTDGFDATYALDASTTTVGGVPATGDQVRVVAAKQGNKAVLVQTVGQGG